ncbi:MAG: hypothetical protein QXK39_03965 [Nitrososphaerota archaeon]
MINCEMDRGYIERSWRCPEEAWGMMLEACFEMLAAYFMKREGRMPRKIVEDLDEVVELGGEPVSVRGQLCVDMRGEASHQQSLQLC